MISQTRPYDWACKGRSAEMAAWRQLVLEEGQDDKPGMGRATAPLDVTKLLSASPPKARVEMGMPLGFPTSVPQDHPLGCQFSAACGIVRVGVAACDDLRSHHSRFHMLFIWSCDCLMSKWPRLRLTKYVDDLTISYRGANHTVTTVITEAVNSMVGWLENGLDGKSVVLVLNVSLKASLASSTKALSMRVVSHARVLCIDAYGAGAARQRRT